METIGERIERFARARYDSLKSFGEACGVGKQQMSKYVSDLNIPGGEVLDRFRKAGMSVDWLLSGAGHMLADPPQEEIDVDTLRRLPPETVIREAAAIYVDLADRVERMEKYAKRLVGEGDFELIDPRTTGIEDARPISELIEERQMKKQPPTKKKTA